MYFHFKSLVYSNQTGCKFWNQLIKTVVCFNIWFKLKRIHIKKYNLKANCSFYGMIKKNVWTHLEAAKSVKVNSP